MGEYMMPKVINHLLKKDSNTVIKMKVANTRELLNYMNEGMIDFALVEGYFNKQEYECLYYCQEQYICVASCEFELDTVNDISELFKYNLITREVGSGTREIIERYLGDRNLDVNDFSSLIEISNLHTIKCLVKNNHGISFMYRMAVEKEINEGLLKEIKISGLKIVHDINFVWRKNSIFADHYQHLFELFMEQD